MVLRPDVSSWVMRSMPRDTRQGIAEDHAEDRDRVLRLVPGVDANHRKQTTAVTFAELPHTGTDAEPLPT